MCLAHLAHAHLSALVLACQAVSIDMIEGKTLFILMLVLTHCRPFGFLLFKHIQ